MVRHDVHLEISESTKGKKLRVKIKKIRPARLRRDKNGRYIISKKGRVYIKSRKSDLKLIKKLIAKASNAKSILTPSTSSHMTPTEGAYIRSIQDANFREALIKNARDLEQQTRAKVDAIVKEHERPASALPAPEQLLLDAAIPAAAHEIGEHGINEGDRVVHVFQDVTPPQSDDEEESDYEQPGSFDRLFERQNATHGLLEQTHANLLDIKQSLNKRFQQDIEKLEIEAAVEQKRHELEMARQAAQRERDQNNMMAKLDKLLAERKTINKQESPDTAKLEYIDEQIELIGRQLDNVDVKRMLDEAVSEQRLERELERAEREKQKTVENMKALEVMAAAAAPKQKQPKPSLLKKPLPSTLPKAVPPARPSPVLAPEVTLRDVPKVKTEPEATSPYSTPPQTSTTTTTTTTTNKRLSIPASSIKAIKDVPKELTPKVEPIIQRYMDGDATLTNPTTLYYQLGKELRTATISQDERRDLQRQLKDDAIQAKRIQDMKSMQQVSASVAPEVLDLIKQYWAGDIGSKQFGTLLKKELKKGSGKVEDGGLYDYEIEKLMMPYTKYGFEGVIASDQLDELKPKQRMSFIMNLDNSHQPGSHWVACNIDAKGDKAIEYYDSFGDDPSSDFMKRMKQLVGEIDPDSPAFHLEFCNACDLVVEFSALEKEVIQRCH
ncbi:hypothetical protein SAMD00019534_113490 [Acytostelium subglobosum LB1]|uniref:hypothetical protein n=1 Tax=Acytostelium subglobosum LB1 TaxID=1410327 RepID=UPI000644FC8E|nr:hypothetical protein SAMD00019534_113490 [Acytostelium subglobosum LB1]GAM28173.1 hypothetical protein SAMD00019534_113490 [Acytostelium subglobosum LB1]|eukprot:XP_012748807.1 hypothetical protein SAMD00019534_113490 [Acytostelium subglobosum LB1]